MCLHLPGEKCLPFWLLPKDLTFFPRSLGWKETWKTTTYILFAPDGSSHRDYMVLISSRGVWVATFAVVVPCLRNYGQWPLRSHASPSQIFSLASLWFPWSQQWKTKDLFMLFGVYPGVIFWHPAFHPVRKPVDTKALYPCSFCIIRGELGINFLSQSNPCGFALWAKARHTCTFWTIFFSPINLAILSAW